MDIDRIQLCPLSESDLGSVMAIEEEVYEFPWSVGNFKDCLTSSYYCQALIIENMIQGYCVMSEGAGEAHVLNVCVHPKWRGKGLGRMMMNHLLEEAKSRNVSTIFLEVRISNQSAIGLYESIGFNEVGRRNGYYPAADGREDAYVMALALSL